MSATECPAAAKIPLGAEAVTFCYEFSALRPGAGMAVGDRLSPTETAIGSCPKKSDNSRPGELHPPT
jgi:hypothetical protein